MLKLLLSHRPVFLITLRILCSINNVLGYINDAWLQVMWILCDSVSYFLIAPGFFKQLSNLALHHLKLFFHSHLPIFLNV